MGVFVLYTPINIFYFYVVECMYMKNKGFTLIELLIVIAIIGILAGIVIVSLSGSTDDANDTAVRANLRSVATLYAEVFADNIKGISTSLSLCDNSKVKSAMDKIFEISTPTGTTRDVAGVYARPGTAGSTGIYSAAKAGCVSNDNGAWVVWSDLSSTDGNAWCIDSDGHNGERVIGTTADVYTNQITASKYKCGEL